MEAEGGPPLLRLANRHLEVEVDPDLGAEVRSVRRPGGPNVLARYEWTAPLSVRRSSGYGDAVLDWLSDYRGGWQELFPNAGDACIVDGVPLPFHGEVSRARWDVVASTPAEVTLRTPARLPLVLERRMRLAADRPALLIDETIRSDAPVPSAFLMGHHPAFVATQDASIDLPEGAAIQVDETYVTDLVDLAPGAAGRWPSVAGRAHGVVRLDRIPAGPVQRVVFASSLGSAPWAAVRGVHPGLGVALAWDVATFPCAWLWWEIGGQDFPWHGRARIVAIEPNTAFPADGLAAARSRGEAHEMAPGGEHRTWLTLVLFDADERPVTGVGRDGAVRLSP
ncbi:hypothetical protein BH23CHL8_BH23CHL8_04160 [soil metagenome]